MVYSGAFLVPLHCRVILDVSYHYYVITVFWPMSIYDVLIQHVEHHLISEGFIMLILYYRVLFVLESNWMEKQKI